MNIDHFECLETRRHLNGDAAPLPIDNFAVNAGGKVFVDANGLTWAAERGFTITRKSRTSATTRSIANTTLDPVLQTSRQDYNLHWAANVSNGTYAVSLYFAEPDYTKPGQRVFDINLQRRRQVANFDVVQAAGGKDAAVVRTFTVRVTNGHLVVDLPSQRDRSILNGIRVQQTAPPVTDADQKVTWGTKKSAPFKAEESVGFVADEKVYSVGGYVNAEFEATTQVQAYDPATDTWTRKADAPTKITHAGVAVDTGRHTVWMLGGFIGDFPEPPGTRAVWRYDYVNDSWRKGPSLPVSRGSGGGAIIGNKLYYFSGATADRQSQSGNSYVLDLGARSPRWTAIAPLPSPRNHFGTVAVGNRVFILGGQTGVEEASEVVGSTWVYNTKTNAWSHTTPMPQAYSHFGNALSLYKDRYVVFAGGEHPHNTALANVNVFDTQRRVWSTLTDLPAPRRAGVGGIVGNTFVHSQGYFYGQNQLDTTWTADLAGLRLA